MDSPDAVPQNPPSLSRRSTDIPDDAPWWAKMLVAGWQDAWQWASVWMATLTGAAPAMYELLPYMQQNIPPNVMHWITTGLAVLTILARLTNQKGTK